MKMLREGTLRPAVIVVALVMLLGSWPAHADDEGEWVEVVGEAAVVNDNEIQAREQALAQALRHAVAQVAGTIVSAISETRDFMSVRDEITSQAAGFVRRYETQDTTCEEGVCRITVRALVERRTLENRLTELGLLVQRRGYPRVILLIAEQNADSEMPSMWWGSSEVRTQYFENELIDYMNRALVDDDACRKELPRKEACWRAIDAAHAFRFTDYASISTSPEVQAVAGTDLTDAQASHIARLTDAEVALVGTAQARKLAEMPAGSMTMLSIGGTATVRAIDVQSGEVLATITVETPARTHISAAQAGALVLQRAARQVVPELQRRLAEAWSAEASGGRWVRLEVEGLGSYNDLREFQTQLEHAVTGIRSVNQRSMAGSSAVLEILTVASARDLADHLSARPLGRFSVRVVRVDAGTLEIDLGN